MSGNPTIEQLQAQLDEANKKASAAEKKAKDATELAELATQANDELTKKLSEKPSSGKTKFPTVSMEKDKYQFTMGSFTYKGTKYTAVEAAKDSVLCKDLIAKGAGCLKKKS